MFPIFQRYKFKSKSQQVIISTLLNVGVFNVSNLAGINILIYAKQEVLDNLSQKEKLFCAIEVLRQIEPLLSKGGIGYKGTSITIYICYAMKRI